MKKLTYLFASLIMVALVVSCSKDATNIDDPALKGAVVNGPSTPVTGVTPYIIPGANNGGNRTCAEVAAFWNLDPNPFICGDRIDYGDNDSDGDKEFDGEFPDGLTVNVTDGKYVSFEMDNCILLDGKWVKVGAVIVKGSNAANVYYYPGGTLGDSGLAAPTNASGKPAGLSNLTFCFIECETVPLVIAFKGYLTQDWACTSGGPGNISFVGYYDFIPGHVGYKIYFTAHTNPATADLSKPVGNLEIGNFDADPNLEVRVDNSDMPALLFRNAYLFVGTLAQYNSSYYLDFPYKTGEITPVASLTFDLPF